MPESEHERVVDLTSWASTDLMQLGKHIWLAGSPRVALKRLDVIRQRLDEVEAWLQDQDETP